MRNNYFQMKYKKFSIGAGLLSAAALSYILSAHYFNSVEKDNIKNNPSSLTKNIIFSSQTHHLGDGKRPFYEFWWDIKKAESLSLEKKFQLDFIPKRARLYMELKFCDFGGEIYLNNEKIGLTPTRKEEEWKKNPKYFGYFIDVPDGLLIKGENILKIISRDRGDDKFGHKEINYDDFLIRNIKLNYDE